MSDKPAIPRSPSKEFVRLNPHLFGSGNHSPASRVATVGDGGDSGKDRTIAKARRRRGMNKTEARFAALLASEGTAHVFEGLTLRWGGTDNDAPMSYTPDFTIPGDGTLPARLIEVKGAHIREKDLVRFKGCRACWPQFCFELWQWKNNRWERQY